MNATVPESFEKQAGWCRALGSPFTAKLIEASATLLDRDDPVMQCIAEWTNDPVLDALPLRLVGALHALVLTQGDEELEAVFPPRATPAPPELAEIVAGAVKRHESHCLDWLTRSPQTNEVARASLLLLGYSWIQRRTGLPLAIREIGASAGLNLNFERFSYRFGDVTWGMPYSQVTLAPAWEGPPPRLPPDIPVADRGGADIEPLDLNVSANRLALQAYCWADQEARLARLAGAIAIARQVGTRVEKIGADSFVAREFAEPRTGVALVLSHTVVWQYLTRPVQTMIERQMARVGSRATREAPIARLAFEPRADGRPTLAVTLWPTGETKVIAEADAHGRRVFMLNAE